ncbi:MAG TPA: hypothetical protein VGB55_00745, partial [Tepidisphaeraceae bacterium]
RTAADRNVSPNIDVVGAIASSQGDDDVSGDLKTYLFTKYSRMVFQRPDDAATFTVRGSIDDHQWQTFAVFAPGGPMQAGPISAVFGQTPDGRATMSLKGQWAWPMRVVFVTAAGEASEARAGSTTFSPLGRWHNAESSVFLLSEVKEAYVQLCGQQRFEIRGLPSDPVPPAQPATLVDEHLRPAVPGLTLLPAAPPPEIAAMEYFRRLEVFKPGTILPGMFPATQPTTQPDAFRP